MVVETCVKCLATCYIVNNSVHVVMVIVAQVKMVVVVEVGMATMAMTQAKMMV